MGSKATHFGSKFRWITFPGIAKQSDDWLSENILRKRRFHGRHFVKKPSMWTRACFLDEIRVVMYIRGEWKFHGNFLMAPPRSCTENSQCCHVSLIAPRYSVHVEDGLLKVRRKAQKNKSNGNLEWYMNVKSNANSHCHRTNIGVSLTAISYSFACDFHMKSKQQQSANCDILNDTRGTCAIALIKLWFLNGSTTSYNEYLLQMIMAIWWNCCAVCQKCIDFVRLFRVDLSRMIDWSGFQVRLSLVTWCSTLFVKLMRTNS